MKKKIKKSGNSSTFESVILKNAVIADEVYNIVIDQLKIDHSDLLYRDLVLVMLKRQTKDNIVFSIWRNLSEEQIVHLREFIDQNGVIDPELKNDQLLMRFALMYPELKAKVFKELSAFFKGFIVRFNGIAEV